VEYVLDLLRKERDKLNNELIEAKIGNEESWNWSLIIKNERILQDVNKAIDIIFDYDMGYLETE
jgi:hypothetical protein